MRLRTSTNLTLLKLGSISNRPTSECMIHPGRQEVMIRSEWTNPANIGNDLNTYSIKPVSANISTAAFEWLAK